MKQRIFQPVGVRRKMTTSLNDSVASTPLARVLMRPLLVARSHALRARLASEALTLQRPLALADRVRGGLHWLAAHPQWIAAVVALPVLLRPRRALGWALKMWSGWRLWRRLSRLLS